MRQSLDFDISFADWESFKAGLKNKEEIYSESWLQHIIDNHVQHFLRSKFESLLADLDGNKSLMAEDKKKVKDTLAGLLKDYLIEKISLLIFAIDNFDGLVVEDKALGNIYANIIHILKNPKYVKGSPDENVLKFNLMPRYESKKEEDDCGDQELLRFVIPATSHAIAELVQKTEDSSECKVLVPIKSYNIKEDAGDISHFLQSKIIFDFIAKFNCVTFLHIDEHDSLLDNIESILRQSSRLSSSEGLFKLLDPSEINKECLAMSTRASDNSAVFRDFLSRFSDFLCGGSDEGMFPVPFHTTILKKNMGGYGFLKGYFSECFYPNAVKYVYSILINKTSGLSIFSEEVSQPAVDVLPGIAFILSLYDDLASTKVKGFDVAGLVGYKHYFIDLFLSLHVSLITKSEAELSAEDIFFNNLVDLRENFEGGSNLTDIAEILHRLNDDVARIISTKPEEKKEAVAFYYYAIIEQSILLLPKYYDLENTSALSLTVSL